MFKPKTRLLASIIGTAAIIGAPLLVEAANPYQSRNMNFGVSGGNVNDITSAFCCSGTLGSLVHAGTTQYILSNDHVLARQDKATPGEDISQPGLVDTGCQPATIVANFTRAVKLGNNVDCAIAQVKAGTMNSTGSIQGIGAISSVIKAPSIGLGVEKSGRTTGTTTGTVGSINTSVNVQYQIRCGQGKKYVISYTNQVVVNSTGFSAGGDSGSLIVTNNSCHQPVALLFAGSSSDTIANPIGEVLSKLGGGLSFVGGTCSTTTSSAQMQGQSDVQSFDLPQQAIDHASRVLEQNRHDLMSRPGVLGVGLGATEDNSAPAIVIYVDQTSSDQPQLPQQIDRVPVRIKFTDPFIAY
jgi:hypothetical protein